MAEQIDVTCATEGCRNFGITITAEVAEVPWAVMCGPCGTILAQSE